VQYGGPWAENWWYEHYDILSDAKLTRFTPFSELERRGLRRPQWFRDSEYSFTLFAEQAKKVVEAGGRVGLGGHGQLQGLGVHWELWTIAKGGMKPMDALRVGTIYGAESIGLAQDLGSVEAGKLADILVLDANPLDDIANTNTIRYVMKNGRMYEGDSLNEIWPRQRAMPKQWWMTNDAAPAPKKP
jgi:Amidohydrolase family